MNYKNVLNQVKHLLSMEVKLEQMKLMDGVTVVEAESFAPEFSVGIVTEEGLVPLPAGNYELEDGKMLMVEVDGIIKEVKEKEEEVEVEVEGEKEVEVEAENQPKKVVESISKETFFAEMEKIKSEFKAELAALKAENESLKTELSSQAGAKAIVPNPEPKENKGFQFSKKANGGIMDSVLAKLSK